MKSKWKWNISIWRSLVYKIKQQEGYKFWNSYSDTNFTRHFCCGWIIGSKFNEKELLIQSQNDKMIVPQHVSQKGNFSWKDHKHSQICWNSKQKFSNLSRSFTFSNLLKLKKFSTFLAKKTNKENKIWLVLRTFYEWR